MLTEGRMPHRKDVVLAAAVAVISAYLLATSFHRGWIQVETDFPNYYTAAVLTLHRQPLAEFYNWTWFQRQMNYAGTERQLGGYTPHTPLTMLPLVPLANLRPQRAKQVWLVFSLLCVAASIALLTRLTGFRSTEVLALALLSYGALSTNFILGQYYLFLLFLLALSAWCLLRGRHFTAGALLGLIFALKLYTAPFLFYFAARRQWKALVGMMASVMVLALAAIAIFGFDGVWFFATTVLVRGLDGSINDPYNPGWGSMTAFLRHSLIPEAELNPHPLMVAPALFFFLRAAYTLGPLAFSLVSLARGAWDEARGFAWFVILLFLLSPNSASYHFALLLVPVALLLRSASLRWSVSLLLLYVLVEVPLRPSYSWLFPKVWILLAMFIYVGWRQFSSIRPKWAMAALALVIATSSLDAWRRSHSYSQESTRVAERAVTNPGNVFASAPAISGTGILYEAMAEGRYVLRDSGSHTFTFDGHAFHPAAAPSGELIYFELVAEGHSRICTFDSSTRNLATVVGSELDPTEPAISADGSKLAFVSAGSLYVQENGRIARVVWSRTASHPAFFPDGQRIAFAEGRPGGRSVKATSVSGEAVTTLINGNDSYSPTVSSDGRRLAYVESGLGASQVWIMDLATGTRWRVTSGACNNDSPAWSDGSKSIVFASDCDRGLGLPGLFKIAAGQRLGAGSVR